MICRVSSWGTSFGLLLLRLGFGSYMALHGWGKLQMLQGGKFDQFPDPLGLGAGNTLILATVTELGCAVLVAIGFLTRLAALGVVSTMGVAAFVVHAQHPWSDPAGPSKELALLYLLAFLSLVFTGPGCCSLDALVFRRNQPTSGAQTSQKSG
ncbi:MAG: hypothetical protein KatS3mg114_1214 [Planctomycetaceae bacterium]|nr:MAG: hypothetical protein KatS3mg114_1214 [Planctomycetaceae bacterium]